MDMKKMGDNITKKGLPAFVGGVGAKAVERLTDNVLKDMKDKDGQPLDEDNYMRKVGKAAPAVLALLVMDGKNGMRDYAAAGMLGATGYSVSSKAIDGALTDDVLADDVLQELFESED
jgi:hypothetical protein